MSSKEDTINIRKVVNKPADAAHGTIKNDVTKNWNTEQVNNTDQFGTTLMIKCDKIWNLLGLRM